MQALCYTFQVAQLKFKAHCKTAKYLVTDIDIIYVGDSININRKPLGPSIEPTNPPSNYFAEHVAR